jgi:hypothetical protein
MQGVGGHGQTNLQISATVGKRAARMSTWRTTTLALHAGLASRSLRLGQSIRCNSHPDVPFVGISAPSARFGLGAIQLLMVVPMVSL